MFGVIYLIIYKVLFVNKKSLPILLLCPSLLISSFAVSGSYFDDNLIESGVTFSNASEELSTFERSGFEGLAGVAWLDYDQDGDLDIFLPNGTGHPNALFSNNGDGTFTDVSVEAKIQGFGGHAGVVVGDIDNDGYPDIFAGGEGFVAGPSLSPVALYHNNGDGTFTDIAESAGIPGPESMLSSAMADINNDGYLDLFIAASGHLGFVFPPAAQHTDRLYLNNGDLTFTDITAEAGVEGGLGSCVVSFSHFNDDNCIDLFVGVCNEVNLAPTPIHLYKNNCDATFTDVSAEAGIDKKGFWMSTAHGDFDNDGDMDLFASNLGPVAASNPHALYRNNGDGTYTDVASTELAVNEFAWGASFGDFDNDGFLDLTFAGSLPFSGLIGPGLGNTGHLFMNDGQGNLIEEQEGLGINLENLFTSGLARGDFDGNGFLDVAIMTSEYTIPGSDGESDQLIPSGGPILLQNDGNENTSTTLRLQGRRSNSMGIGAKIEVFADGNKYLREVIAGSSFASSESPWIHVGLGKAKKGKARITWPSGLVEWHAVKSGEIVDIVEGKGHYWRWFY